MSKDFDVTLSDAIDLAAGAAQTPGASAARIRGRKRAVRKRIAVTTTSFALVAVCATVGFKASSSSHDSGTPAAPSSASISPSASVPVSATTSGSAAPSTHPSTTSTAPAGPTSTTPSGTAPQATVPSPGRYVAGAWLSPTQLPFARAGYTTWDHAGGVGTLLGGSAYEQTVQQYTANNSCSSIAAPSALGDGLSKALTGAQIQVFQSSNFGKILPNGIIPAYASQYALFYPNATAATAAMNALSADYAACKTQVTGSDPATGTTLAGSVQQTVNGGSAQCWSLLAAQPGSAAANGTVDHTCFVRSGAMIGTVTVSINQVSSLSTVSFTSSDGTMVPELGQDLAAYYSGS
ncbi:MAG: hypothetical protein JWM19_5081 [Actinomycetia bacterium]|nr:hypothetical protein [Actinomycetes bacterium]